LDCEERDPGKFGCYWKEGVCYGFLPEASIYNIKDSSKYLPKQVFLVPSDDWRTVLPLVPVAVWTGNEGWCTRGYGTPEKVCVYPLLVYYQGKSSGKPIDVDSTIHFLQQYLPDRAIISSSGEFNTECSKGEPIASDCNLLHLLTSEETFGYISSKNYLDEEGRLYNKVYDLPIGANLDKNVVGLISPEDYFSFWKNYESIVYVEDNYYTALLASSYASLINSPLIIAGTNLDKASAFSGKSIICVGDVSRTCDKKFGLSELEKEYRDITKTNKVVLVNPSDLGSEMSLKMPTRRAGEIYEAYGSDSLAAPALASAKHQLLLSIANQDMVRLKTILDRKMSNLGIEPEFLTIAIGPNKLKMYEGNGYNGQGIPNDMALSYRGYIEDGVMEWPVGRIFGITVSDTSSNIARSIFYDRVSGSKNSVLINVDQFNQDPCTLNHAPIKFTQILDSLGYETTLNAYPYMEDYADSIEWSDKVLVGYFGHGNINYGGINTQYIPPLDSSVVIVGACSTCLFSEGSAKDMFCSNIIRQGAVAYIGATKPALGGFEGILDELLEEDSSLGEAFMAAVNHDLAGVIVDSRLSQTNAEPPNAILYSYDIPLWLQDYILLGDPTLKLNPSHSLPKSSIYILEDLGSLKRFEVRTPIRKINYPTYLENCGYPKDSEIELDNFARRFAAFSFNGFEVPPSAVTGDNAIIFIEKKYNSDRKYMYVRDRSKTPFVVYRDEEAYFQSLPDYAISELGLDYESGSLSFRIKNIGYVEGSASIMIYMLVWGCLNEACTGTDPSRDYFWASQEAIGEVTLSPGEFVNYEYRFPQECENGALFGDARYKRYAVDVYFVADEEFAQISEENDEKSVFG
jgi:hypothetical protein